MSKHRAKSFEAPKGKILACCPDFALCPNDFSLDFTEIAADFAIAGIALQIEFYEVFVDESLKAQA